MNRNGSMVTKNSVSENANAITFKVKWIYVSLFHLVLEERNHIDEYILKALRTPLWIMMDGSKETVEEMFRRRWLSLCKLKDNIHVREEKYSKELGKNAPKILTLLNFSVVSALAVFKYIATNSVHDMIGANISFWNVFWQRIPVLSSSCGNNACLN